MIAVFCAVAEGYTLFVEVIQFPEGFPRMNVIFHDIRYANAGNFSGPLYFCGDDGSSKAYYKVQRENKTMKIARTERHKAGTITLVWR